jgi:hypothetical protein
MDEIVVEGFPKNATTLVAGFINEHNGHELVHVREMKAALNEGGWIHGKGVALDVGRVWELLDGVRRLRDVGALDQVVARLPVNKDEIRIGVNPFKGNQYAYVRRFYPDGDGGWLPSPKGVSIRTELIDDLIELVEGLAAAAVTQGLTVAPKGGSDVGC